MMKLCLSLQNIVFALLAILMFHMVRTQGDFYYRIVGDQCIRTCAHLRDIPNVTFNCDGDNSTCDWQCAAQRMGCAEGLIYHCAQDFKNLELKLNKTEYIQACAPERFCNAGEEPSVTFSFDDVVQSPRNAKINCVACTDPNFYNKQDGQSSASYSRCYHQKFNKCIPEYHKINCDDISWLERKQTDGYCRCDARNGYAPENENVKTMCFYSDELCAPKTCPIPSQELLLNLTNYTCGDRCPSGMHRTEKSDECVPNKPVQTTRSTPLTLSSQPRSVQTETNAGISTTKETVKVLSTKGREENGGSDGSNKDTIILVSVLISLAVTALLVLLIAIRLRRESQQNTPEEKRKSLVKKIAGSYIKMKVINSTVHFDSAHPNTTKEPHETSFINGIDRPTSAAINDQDTDDTEDKPFLQGPRQEESPSPESTNTTTTAPIPAHPNTTEEQQETSFINGIDRPTSAAINDQDTDATEDKPFLQGPRHEENRPPKSTNTTATAPIPVTSHVLGGKISEKKLSPCVDPVYPSVGAYTAGATFCPNRDGATATEELDERTNGQATPCVIGDIESVEKLQESDSDEKSDFDTDSGSQEETISFLDETASKHM